MRRGRLLSSAMMLVISKDSTVEPGYTGLHTFFSLYRKSQQIRAGIICMRSGASIPEFSLYRNFSCPAHTFVSGISRFDCITILYN